MRVSGSIPSMVNGVSQQAPSLRLPNQAAAVENAVSSLVNGCYRRPGFNYIGPKVTTTAAPHHPAIHWIVEDDTNRYVVVVDHNGIQVFDLQGNAKTVVMDGGASYVEFGSVGLFDRSKFRFLTIADTTFICRTDVAAAMTSSTATAQEHKAIIWVKGGVTAYTYSVTVNGTKVTATKASGVTETDDITALLVTALTVTGTPPCPLASWNCVAYPGGYIVLSKKDASDFTIEAHDSYNEQEIAIIKEQVALVSDLPDFGPNNLVVKVTGTADVPADDLYLKFSATGGATGGGIWVECTAPGQKYALDPATMPHTLEHRSDDTFHFNVETWVDRAAGDDTTNPQPSFVGSKITEMFLFKNRLGYLSEDRVFMSTSGDFLNPWRSTVSSLLDDAPIDTPVPGVGSSLLQWAVPFNQDLLLFSKSHQFTLRGQDILSPKTVSITMTTAYQSGSRCRPESSGSSVFFPVPLGSYVGVGEYFIDENSDSSDAEPITAHCPAYLLGDATVMTASTTAEFLCVCTSVFTPEVLQFSLFMYNWKWSGNQKAQSAWTKWVVPYRVMSAKLIDSTLYVMFGVTGTTEYCFLGSLDLTTVPTYAGTSDSIPNVDMPTAAAPYTFASTRWWIATPTIVSSQAEAVAYPSSISLYYRNEKICDITSGGGEIANVSANWDVASRVVSNRLEVGLKSHLAHTFASNWSTELGVDPYLATLYLGIPIPFTYTFSPPFIKDTTESGKSSIEGNRLEVQGYRIRFISSGDFTATVAPRGGSTTYTTTHAAPTAFTESGILFVPVRGRADRATLSVTSSSVLPLSLVSAQWEGNWTPNSRRV